MRTKQIMREREANYEKVIYGVVFAALFLLPRADAITMEGDILMNTSSSGSQYFNDLNTTLANISVGSSEISFSDLHYFNGELGVDIAHPLTIDGTDFRVNTTGFPFLNYSDNFTKNVSMNYNKQVNATLEFDVANCGNLSSMNYSSFGGDPNYSINKAAINCVGKRAEFLFIGINNAAPPRTNIISIFYSDGAWAVATTGGVLGIAGLFVFMGRRLEDENKVISKFLYLTTALMLVTAAFIVTLLVEGLNSKVYELTQYYYRGLVYAFIGFTIIFMGRESMKIINLLRVRS